MLAHQTTIYVEDAAPEFSGITQPNGKPHVHVKLVPQTRHDSLLSTVMLCGTVSELREWIGSLGMVVAEAEAQVFADVAGEHIQSTALSDHGAHVLGQATA